MQLMVLVRCMCFSPTMTPEDWEKAQDEALHAAGIESLERRIMDLALERTGASNGAIFLWDRKAKGLSVDFHVVDGVVVNLPGSCCTNGTTDAETASRSPATRRMSPTSATTRARTPTTPPTFRTCFHPGRPDPLPRQTHRGHHSIVEAGWGVQGRARRRAPRPGRGVRQVPAPRAALPGDTRRIWPAVLDQGTVARVADGGAADRAGVSDQRAGPDPR